MGRDPGTGKRLRHFESIKGSKKDAERRLHELLYSLEKGSFVKPSTLTVTQYLEQWLQDYAIVNTGPRTYEGYAGIVHAHLIPALGSIPLVALQPQHIQNYYSKALQFGRKDGNGGLSAETIRHAHATILLEQGVHPKIVQERLGHSSVSTTLDIYSHVVPGLQEAAARKFEEGLEDTPNEVPQENVGKVSAKLP